MIARALTRKGTALAKMAKSSKDFEVAIEVFQKALTEHRNPDTLKKLNDAEKARKELEQQEYFNPQIADEEREKGIFFLMLSELFYSYGSNFLHYVAGNQFFKEMKYPEAVKHYTESIKRNPKDPRVFISSVTFLDSRTFLSPSLRAESLFFCQAYSNRAACYTKLAALPEGLKDAEKCIELDPTFVKGYTRKGAVQFFMKEYEKAMETYQEGLKHDPQNQELLDGVKR